MNVRVAFRFHLFLDSRALHFVHHDARCSKVAGGVPANKFKSS